MYDMVRATRDARFGYLRNYYPLQPYIQFVPFRNHAGIMQALLTLRERGRPEGPIAAWLAGSRPPEELYDLHADPHEIRNLAADPAYAPVLERMRSATDAWMERIDDLGDLPEDRMVRQMWLGGPQPVTAAPVITPRSASSFGPPDTLRAGQEIDLYSGTHGASLGYTLESGPNPRWRLYHAPLTLPPGTHTLRARAIRYGYAPSQETAVTLTVLPATP